MPRQPFNKKFIKDVINELEKTTVKRMNAIAIRAHSRLVVATPVDYGQARAGWNFTLNKRGDFVPADPVRTSDRVHGTGEIKPPVSLPDKTAKNFNDFYHITNFVSHIVFLNEGHSEQAPQKFVERELLASIKDVERAGF